MVGPALLLFELPFKARDLFPKRGRVGFISRFERRLLSRLRRCDLCLSFPKGFKIRCFVFESARLCFFLNRFEL